jgi:hypothetical protein
MCSADAGSGSIPRLAHFIWLGRNFHWVYGAAVQTAALHGGFDRVILHHDQDLSDCAGWSLLQDTPTVECRRLVADELLGQLPDLGPDLLPLYGRLKKAEARSNLLRVALLYRDGGVYLDTDTVTVRSFAPLWRERSFCGLERIALPARIVRSRRPGVWIGAMVRLGLRDFCRRMPEGWRLFRLVSRLYALAPNNAVVGGRPGDSFLRRWLEAMTALPPEHQQRRFALGPHLLQHLIAAEAHDSPRLCPAEMFYPLAPEVSQHWFRAVRQPRVHQAISSATISVHWYASVRTRALVPHIDAQYIRAHADRQLFSALCAQALAPGAGSFGRASQQMGVGRATAGRA